MYSEFSLVIGSYILLCLLLPGMSGGFFINRFGRKGSILYNTVFFALSYLCLVTAQNVWMLFAGRFLSGMATGHSFYEVHGFEFPAKTIFANNSKVIISTYHWLDFSGLKDLKNVSVLFIVFLNKAKMVFAN